MISKGAEKIFLVKIKKKNVVANYKDTVNIRTFEGNGSIQNPHANQINKLWLFINRDKLAKKESVTKNSRNF